MAGLRAEIFAEGGSFFECLDHQSSRLRPSKIQTSTERGSLAPSIEFLSRSSMRTTSTYSISTERLSSRSSSTGRRTHSLRFRLRTRLRRSLIFRSEFTRSRTTLHSPSQLTFTLKDSRNSSLATWGSTCQEIRLTFLPIQRRKPSKWTSLFHQWTYLEVWIIRTVLM